MRDSTDFEKRIGNFSRMHSLGNHWDNTPDAGHDSWVLSLSDLMTLMLIFFLIWMTVKMTALKTIPDIKNPVETAGLEPVRDLESIFMEMAPVEKRKGNLIIVLQEELTFPSGSALLTEQGRNIISRIAGILKQETGYELDILGHTDSVAVRTGGKWHSNLELSMARASAVFTALAEAGISPARMKAQGLGALYPVKSETGDPFASESRRVELVLRPATQK